ncbi:MAG: hypothetical protein AAFY73_03140 [Pseudomonadota bacterium]
MFLQVALRKFEKSRKNSKTALTVGPSQIYIPLTNETAALLAQHFGSAVTNQARRRESGNLPPGKWDENLFAERSVIASVL